MPIRTGKRLTTQVTDHILDKLQQTVLDKAERLIESETTVMLTRRESLRLLELTENPLPRNEHFNKLMTDYQKWNADGSDSSIEWSPR